ncbi:hypothetical protein ACSBR1_043819 [Camellia fascicularis]
METLTLCLVGGFEKGFGKGNGKKKLKDNSSWVLFLQEGPQRYIIWRISNTKRVASILITRTNVCNYGQQACPTWMRQFSQTHQRSIQHVLSSKHKPFRTALWHLKEDQ